MGARLLCGSVSHTHNGVVKYHALIQIHRNCQCGGTNMDSEECDTDSFIGENTFDTPDEAGHEAAAIGIKNAKASGYLDDSEPS